MSMYNTSACSLLETILITEHREVSSCLRVEQFFKKPNWRGEIADFVMKSDIFVWIIFSRTIETQHRREMGR